MVQIHRIIQAKSVGQYELELAFDDGSHGAVDFEPVIREGGVYAPLADADVFRKFSVNQNGRVLAWPGEVEFCADSLWMAAMSGTGLHSEVTREQ